MALRTVFFLSITPPVRSDRGRFDYTDVSSPGGALPRMTDRLKAPLAVGTADPGGALPRMTDRLRANPSLVLSAVRKNRKIPASKKKRGFGDPERTRTVDLQRDRLAC